MNRYAFRDHRAGQKLVPLKTTITIEAPDEKTARPVLENYGITLPDGVTVVGA